MAQKQNRATFVCDYFDEDIVYRISRRGKTEFGVIVESCENASDEEDDDWNNLSWKRMKSGLTKIAWYPKGNTEVVAEKKVKLYDRSLLPGDVVRCLQQSKNNQHGYCKETKVALTLKIQGTEKIIENVDCEAFTPLSTISSDVVCIYKSWVGYVNEVKHNVTLRCEDGSQAVVLMDDIFDFEDIWDERDDSSEFVSDVFHVGQQLVGSKRYLKKANWTSITNEMKIYLDSKNRNHSRIKATVIDVNVASVSLKWLCCVANETQLKSGDMVPPSTIITGDEIQNIRCLNYFQKCSLQVGDEGYYVIRDGDRISPFRKWLENVTTTLISETVNSHASTNDEIVTEDMPSESDWQFVDNSDEEAFSIQDMDNTQSVSSSASSFRARKSKYVSVSVKKIRKKKVKPSKRKDLRPETVDLSTNSRVAVEVVAEKTFVTVIWQNGDIEDNIPSSYLYPIHHIDNHDFFPGDFVVDNNDCVNTYGVVQRVDHSARTASVKWFEMFDGNNSVPEVLKSEDVSVYDIKDHPDFHYRPGCCIVRIATKQSDSLDAGSRVGQVIDITIDGSLLCAWSDGSKSYAFPQELYIIGEYDSDDLWADSDDESVEGNSFWETECERTLCGSISSPTDELQTPTSGKKSKEPAFGNMVDTLRKTITQLEEWFSQNQHLNRRNSLCPMQKIFKVCRELNTIDNMLGTNLLKLKELQSLVDTTKPPPDSPGTIQAVSNKIKKLLSCINSTPKLNSGNEQENEAHNSSVSVSNNTDVCLDLLKNLKSQLSRFCSNVDAIKLSVKVSHEDSEPAVVQEISTPEDVNKEEDVNTEEDVIFRDSNAPIGVLKFMDSVPDSHKFKLSIFVPKNEKLFLKQVRKETMLLESSLPSDIIVKGFSDRMDLFSVLIKGAKRTPYEDGLFLFDVQFPSNYPDVPPVVHYLSFCSDRLNPNLYDSGKVCVSLLGTWSGKGTEVWTKSSTLLQVLISIQALILVDEPYYNEAGYLKQKGTLVGQENSRLYNEMVVVKLVQSMTKLVESPGEIFMDEIREHFTNRGKCFINRLEKWLTLSSFDTENTEDINSDLPEFPLLPGSQGFCLSLQRALTNFKQCLKSSDICLN